MTTWYEVSGLTPLGEPFVMTTHHEQQYAINLAALLRDEEGCTDIVIVVRRN